MIQQGTPSPEEGTHFARLAEAAADGLYQGLYGRKWQRILEMMYCEPDNEYNHQHVYFFRADDAVAGMVHHFTSAQHEQFEQQTGILQLRLAGWQIPRMLFVGLMMRPVLNFISEIPPRHCYIQHLAIYPEFRGQGISQVLLNHAEAYGRAQGCTHLALDVKTDNTVAIKAYQKFDFVARKQSPTVRINGEAVSMYRMVKPLG